MAYSRDDIDKVRERSDLAELAAEITKVKRSGRSVMAVCPFHSEKTPSLSIDPARGLYHCFGCGKSGDVFRWVEETQGLDFNGSVEFLARRAGVTITPDPGSAKRRGRREKLVSAVETAIAFYHDRLRNADDAGSARGYVRSRGYDASVVERFKIGYSPEEWDQLVRHLRSEGVGEQAMVRAGLASRSSRGSLIDRFRGRLMFPIYDVRGDGVGFGARQLGGDGPKYLNSPETPIYHKSRLLYGLNWAKSHIVRADESVVVEGYTDVIAFHEAGAPLAVATCGTALGADHLDLLRRFSERVVLAFDADEAGAGAALRGFEHSVPGDLDLRVAVLPSGRDPADLVSSGEIEALEKAVGESTPLLQYRIERELVAFDLTEPEARGRAVRSAAALIALHSDAVTRHEYAVLVARRTGVDLEVVESAIQPSRREPSVGERPASEGPLTGDEKAERALLRLVLANDPSVRTDEVGPDLFSTARHRQAYDLVAPVIEGLAPGVLPDLGAAIGTDESDAAELLRRIALDDAPLEPSAALIKRLKAAAVQRRIDIMRSELAEVDPDSESQRYSELFGRLIALENERRTLRSGQ